MCCSPNWIAIAASMTFLCAFTASGSQEVTFSSDKGVQLAGTLTIPESPKAITLIVTGTGPNDRNMSVWQTDDDGNPTAFKYHLHVSLAEALAKSGIATLRYDKRGVGKSTGDFDSAVLTDFVADARAGMSYLFSHPKLKHLPVGIIGHSQGGAIAQILATERELSFVVFLATPFMRGDKIGSVVFSFEFEHGKRDEQDYTINYEFNSWLFKNLVHDIQPNRDMVAKFVKKCCDKYAKLWGEHCAQKRKEFEDSIFAASRGITKNRKLQLRVQHDPAKYMNKIRCPKLIVQGMWDKHIVAEPNLAQLAKIYGTSEQDIRNLDTSDLRVHTYSKMNHLLQDINKSQIFMPETEIVQDTSRKVIQDIVEWFGEKSGDFNRRRRKDR